jgi:hypothetical protein
VGTASVFIGVHGFSNMAHADPPTSSSPPTNKELALSSYPTSNNPYPQNTTFTAPGGGTGVLSVKHTVTSTPSTTVDDRYATWDGTYMAEITARLGTSVAHKTNPADTYAPGPGVVVTSNYPPTHSDPAKRGKPHTWDIHTGGTELSCTADISWTVTKHSNTQINLAYNTQNLVGSDDKTVSGQSVKLKANLKLDPTAGLKDGAVTIAPITSAKLAWQTSGSGTWTIEWNGTALKVTIGSGTPVTEEKEESGSLGVGYELKDPK